MSDAPRLKARPDAGLAVTVVRGEALAGLRADWERLYDEALEPNPFYGPDFLLPLLRHVGPAESLEALCVWGEDAGGRSLRGLAPISAPGRAASLFGPRRGWSNDYIVNTMPLVASGEAGAVWAAILDQLGRARGLLVLDDLVMDGAATVALLGALAARGGRFAWLDAHERAGIDPHAAGRAPLSGRRLKDLRRDLRRLGPDATLRRAEGEEGQERALAAFLAQEAMGWKGEAGTALACRPASLAFAREALGPAARRPAVRIDELVAGGVGVASAVTLGGDAYAAAFKSAYDPAHARASPGALLDWLTLEDALATGWTRRIDSVALPGHSIEGLWRDRVPVGSLALSPGGASAGEFDLLVGIERLRRRGREAAKAAYHGLKGWLAAQAGGRGA